MTSNVPALDSLVVCDLDNTLIEPDKHFDPELPVLVAAAREQGIGFTLATGRVFAAAERYARLLDIDLPLITNSGAFVSDPSGEHVYRELRLPIETTLRLLEQTEDVPALRYLHVGGSIYAEEPDPESERYARILEVPFHYVGSLAPWLREKGREPVVLVVRFMRDDESIEAAKSFSRTARTEYKGELSVLRTLPHLVEFLNPRASKGKALALVARLLGVPLCQTIALGDSDGDMDMLEAAGRGILVRNAPRELWERADRVTRGRAAEGVKEVLRALLKPD